MNLRLFVLAAVAGVADLGAQTEQSAIPLTPPVLLRTGWKISPAGRQIAVGDLPMRLAVSKDVRYVFVLNGGYAPPTVSTIDREKGESISTLTLPDAWQGMILSPSGEQLYVGGGSTGKVFELGVAAGGTLRVSREFVLPATRGEGAPFAGDVVLSPDGRVLYAADLYGDSVHQVNLQSGKVVDHWKTGRRPYRMAISPNGAQLLIGSWAEGTIYEHESGTGVLQGKLRVGAHPAAILWLNKPQPPEEEGGTSFAGRVFVAAANSNNVYAFGVAADGQLVSGESIKLGSTPMHPLGMTPSALAVNEDGSRLFVTCSDANALAEVDISGAHAHLQGFIPTGAYPTDVAAPQDQVMVANGGGDGKSAGTVSVFVQPRAEEVSRLTAANVANSPYSDEQVYGPITDGAEAFFARAQDHESPIKHVIYLVRGIGSYDAVLGDLGKGNGDKSLVQFGSAITPIAHQLATEYLLFDNFFTNGDGLADGENWASASIAPDYTAKLWKSAAAGRSRVHNFTGGELANTAPTGYIWSNALIGGLSVRNYGLWVQNTPQAQPAGSNQIAKVLDPSLAAVTDLKYRGTDVAYGDVARAKEFIREWNDFSSKNNAPQLCVVSLNNNEMPDAAAVKDNDAALGQIVAAVASSSLWSTTAIFVVQSASISNDHVGSGRAPVFVVSPYTRSAKVDSNFYNNLSVLKSIELTLGLRPMTHYDAGASSMFGSFNRTPSPAR